MKYILNLALILFCSLFLIYFFILISEKFNRKQNNTKYYLELQKSLENEEENAKNLLEEVQELTHNVSQEKIARNLLWKKKNNETILKLITGMPETPTIILEKNVTTTPKPIKEWEEILF